MSCGRKPRTYIVYKNGIEFMVGTVEDIAEALGKTKQSVYKLKKRRKRFEKGSLVSVFLGGNDWALYQGENILMIDTIEEIARKQNVTIQTIKNYSYPSHIERNKKKKDYFFMEELDV